MDWIYITHGLKGPSDRTSPERLPELAIFPKNTYFYTIKWTLYNKPSCLSSRFIFLMDDARALPGASGFEARFPHLKDRS